VRLAVLFEEPPMLLVPNDIIDKRQLFKNTDELGPESQTGGKSTKERPRYGGNPFTTRKQRHRDYFNMGPNSAAPEQKLSSRGETGDGGESKRPLMNALGSPERKEDWQEPLGIK
jgi:hypothetical protein